MTDKNDVIKWVRNRIGECQEEIDDLRKTLFALTGKPAVIEQPQKEEPRIVRRIVTRKIRRTYNSDESPRALTLEILKQRNGTSGNVFMALRDSGLTHRQVHNALYHLKKEGVISLDKETHIYSINEQQE